MLIEFKLPELGENIEAADITKVFVSVGDEIEVDQAVLEIETDKATVEVPSEVNGTVKEVLVKDGDSAKVGQVVFKIDSDGSNSVEEESPAEPEVSKVPVVEENKVEPVVVAPASSASGTVKVELPELGENIEAADITKVLISVGDKISVDQPIIEIETDKATVEVPSEVAGTVKEVLVKDGENAKVGQVIFVVEAEGSKPAAKAEVKPALPKVEEKISVPVKPPTQEVKKEEAVKPARSVKRIKEANIVPAAPTVRRFAREIGIEISKVNGTGPGGRISIDDVKVFAKSINEQLTKTGGAISFGVQPESLPDFSKWGNVERKPMSNIRKKTAEHLSYAWTSIPHVTQYDKADITEIEKLRKQFAPQAEAAGGKLTVTVILLKIVAAALKKFPQFNASVDMANKEIIYKDYFNVGIAVDTDRGLLVPVIRDVDKKNLVELSAELAEISAKARDKKLTLEEMQGGNFSISNLGGIGGTYFTPIINSPEVAILGVSRGSKEAVFVNGEFVPRLMLPISLSYDHRIIDGADGARFIRWISQALENPFMLSLEA